MTMQHEQFTDGPSGEVLGDGSGTTQESSVAQEEAESTDVGNGNPPPPPTN